MKVKILTILAVVLLLIAGIAGYFAYQTTEKEKVIEKEMQGISEIENTFSTTEKREEKLEILKGILKEQDSYNQSKEPSKEVSDKYAATISTMQKGFQKEYDAGIEENTLSELETVKDMEVIQTYQENLNTLLSNIEVEKEYTLPSDEEYEVYKQEIIDLTKNYENRIANLEEIKRKAEEEAQKQVEEERAKTHYENAYFSVDVPKEWVGFWSVTETDNSMNGIASIRYDFSCDPPGEDNGGGVSVYVLDMSDTSIPLSHYSRMIPEYCEEIGWTSSGSYDVFQTEAGAGFFSAGATITLK